MTRADPPNFRISNRSQKYAQLAVDVNMMVHVMKTQLATIFPHPVFTVHDYIRRSIVRYLVNLLRHVAHPPLKQDDGLGCNCLGVVCHESS